MPTREEERETIARQEQKSRESALRFENIRTESEREIDMVAIIRECLAEAARGNLKSHLLRLIQLRSYGSHSGEDNWLRTGTAFKKGFCLQILPDKFGEFKSRGEEYAQFQHDGVCLISTTLDVITTEQTGIFAALGQTETGRFPIYVPPPPPPDGWRPQARTSPPPDRSAEADATPGDRSAGARRSPEIVYPDVPMMIWKTQKGSYTASRPWSLQVPPHFQQSYDLGTPAAAWVNKMQQAWQSMKLVYLPGEVDGAY